ncbi:MAG: cobalt ECF transporter T component CbiQ [Planctomycetaceae bacterium]|nr:cobalt ECF transporter T component CbiQ [Planctomycetaceae bacterium]
MSFVDRYGRSSTVCHRLPAMVKLWLAISIIAVGVSLPTEFWPLQGLLACVVFCGLTLARVPMSYLLRRLALFLPMLFVLSISLPASQGFQGGWDIMAKIIIRSIVAFTTMLWLINVMPFDELLVSLRRLRVPDILLATLSFMYRYIYVLWDELEKLTTARRARSFANDRRWTSWRTSAQMIGMLLIRALQRAERVHGAMLSRGWNGQAHYLPSQSRGRTQPSFSDSGIRSGKK